MASNCCGRPVAAECRCYTEAKVIVASLRAFVGRRVRNPHDADDVTQDVLLRLYRGARDLADDHALEGWMYRIARNAIVDHHRRAATRPDPTDTAPDTAAAEPEDARAARGVRPGAPRPGTRALPDRPTAHGPRRRDPGTRGTAGRALDVGHEVAGTARPPDAARVGHPLLRGRPRSRGRLAELDLRDGRNC